MGRKEGGRGGEARQGSARRKLDCGPALGPSPLCFPDADPDPPPGSWTPVPAPTRRPPRRNRSPGLQPSASVLPPCCQHRRPLPSLSPGRPPKAQRPQGPASEEGSGKATRHPLSNLPPRAAQGRGRGSAHAQRAGAERAGLVGGARADWLMRRATVGGPAVTGRAGRGDWLAAAVGGRGAQIGGCGARGGEWGSASPERSGGCWAAAGGGPYRLAQPERRLCGGPRADPRARARAGAGGARSGTAALRYPAPRARRGES